MVKLFPWTRPIAAWRARATVREVILARVVAGDPLPDALVALAEDVPRSRTRLLAAAEAMRAAGDPAAALPALGRLAGPDVRLALALRAESGGDDPRPALAALRRAAALRTELAATTLARMAYPLVVTLGTLLVFLPMLSLRVLTGPWLAAVSPPSAEAAATLAPLAAATLLAVAAAVLIGAAALFVLLRRHRAHTLAYAVAARLPFVGPVVSSAAAAAFADQLAGLVAAGVPLPEAVRRAADRSGYRALAAHAPALADELAHGHDLVDVLRTAPRLPGTLAWTVGTPSSSSLADQLAEAARLLADEARAAAARSAFYAYPTVLVAVAAAVGVAVVSDWRILFLLGRGL